MQFGVFFGFFFKNYHNLEGHLGPNPISTKVGDSTYSSNPG